MPLLLYSTHKCYHTAVSTASKQMPGIGVLVLLLSLTLPLSQSFVVCPAQTTPIYTRRSHTCQNMCSSSAAGESEVVIRNEDEAYDLHGLLTVKREDSKSVWVLCHGLLASSQVGCPRFISDELAANTFRQARSQYLLFTSSVLDAAGSSSSRAVVIHAHRP